MDLFRVLYMKKTGQILPNASLHEILFARSNGSITKTIDWTPSITVNDAIAGAVIDYQTKITATQSGSGDPTPSNIRPISGFTGANISVNGSTVTVSWLSEAGTVYGGVLDVTTGELTVTHTAEVYDGTEEGWLELSGSLGYYLHFSEAKNIYSRAELLKCSCLIGTNSSYSTSMPLNSIMLNGSKTNLLCRVDTTNDFPSLDSWKAFLTQNPMTVLFPLAEPVTYTLTPEEITLLAGSNMISSNTGDSKMTYKAGR